MIDSLSDDVARSLRHLAFALDQFEPYPQSLVAEAMLRRLVEEGLVEAGRSCRPAVGAVGYRLTGKGWTIVHERWAQRSPSAALA